MIVLAIESASVSASCAICMDNIILGEFTIRHKKTHSEKLMPLIEKLINELDLKISDIDVIAISEGPGSYTGLRIGAAIAKSIAYALNIPIVNVPTMKSLASNIYDINKLIVPIMDAKSGRVYSGIYSWNNERLETVIDQFPCNIDELIKILNKYEKQIIFNGDGSENYRELLEDGLNKPVFAPKHFNYLKATSLAFLGYEMAAEGKIVNSSEFVPKYLRLSQAERNKSNS